MLTDISKNPISRGLVLLVVVIALVGFALVGSAHAEPPSVTELIARIDKASASIDTLAGDFVQKNRLKLFKQELKSEGRVAYRRPRQIRWEYTKPDPSTLVLDDKRATLTTPGAAPQVFDLERDPTMRIVFDQLLVWLGTGPKDEARLASDYTMSTLEKAGESVLVLIPKDSSPVAKVFTRIELRLDKKSSLLKSLLLLERSGDEKEIVFTKLTRNAALNATTFAPATK